MEESGGWSPLKRGVVIPLAVQTPSSKPLSYKTLFVKYPNSLHSIKYSNNCQIFVPNNRQKMLQKYIKMF